MNEVIKMNYQAFLAISLFSFIQVLHSLTWQTYKRTRGRVVKWGQAGSVHQSSERHSGLKKCYRASKTGRLIEQEGGGGHWEQRAHQGRPDSGDSGAWPTELEQTIPGGFQKQKSVGWLHYEKGGSDIGGGAEGWGHGEGQNVELALKCKGSPRKILGRE